MKQREVIALVVHRIVNDPYFKRFDTCVEWDDLFFDYAECEVKYDGKIYRLRTDTCDNLYIKFREYEQIHLDRAMDEA